MQLKVRSLHKGCFLVLSSRVGPLSLLALLGASGARVGVPSLVLHRGQSGAWGCSYSISGRADGEGGPQALELQAVPAWPPSPHGALCAEERSWLGPACLPRRGHEGEWWVGRDSRSEKEPCTGNATGGPGRPSRCA